MGLSKTKGNRGVHGKEFSQEILKKSEKLHVSEGDKRQRQGWILPRLRFLALIMEGWGLHDEFLDGFFGSSVAVFTICYPCL